MDQDDRHPVRLRGLDPYIVNVHALGYVGFGVVPVWSGLGRVCRHRETIASGLWQFVQTKTMVVVCTLQLSPLPPGSADPRLLGLCHLGHVRWR